MYVILTYDVNVERLAKVLKYLRQYMVWVQNSVFEGDLTSAELMEMLDGLKELIDEDEDSIRIYILPSKKILGTLIIGRRYDTSHEDTIL